jgi:hypothetical protein
MGLIVTMGIPGMFRVALHGGERRDPHKQNDAHAEVDNRFDGRLCT